MRVAFTDILNILPAVLRILLVITIIFEFIIPWTPIHPIIHLVINVFIYVLLLISFKIYNNGVILQKHVLVTRCDVINEIHLICTLDANGKFIEINENLCELLKYSESELKNMSFEHILEHPDQSIFKKLSLREALENDESVEQYFTVIDKWGLRHIIHGKFIPIHQYVGSLDRIAVVAMEITNAVSAQMDVKTQNMYLSYAAKILRHDMHSGINVYIPRGLNRLTREFTEEELIKYKAPLNLITAGLRQTQQTYLAIREFTNLVQPNPNRVVSKTALNLEDLLSNFLNDTVYKKQVIISKLPTIPVNGPLFCVAINNLILNGLKYNDSETKYVKIYMLDDETLCVEDNGRGISNEQLQELTKAYIRLPDQQELGDGLGLNICCMIFKEHGFKFSAEKLECGTRIKIQFGGDA